MYEGVKAADAACMRCIEPESCCMGRVRACCSISSIRLTLAWVRVWAWVWQAKQGSEFGVGDMLQYDVREAPGRSSSSSSWNELGRASKAVACLSAHARPCVHVCIHACRLQLVHMHNSQ